MNRSEVMLIMGTLQVAYPRFYANKPKEEINLAINLWTKMLEDLIAEQVTLAVNKIIATSEWPPSIADVRKAVTETQNGAIKDTGEAWGEVTAAIRQFGYMREKEALESMSEETKKTVKYIGWQTICTSENLIAERAHFFKIYEAVKKRSLEQNQLPLFVKDKILENIEMNRPKNQVIESKETIPFTDDNILPIPEKVSEIFKKMFNKA